jgi:glycosyltransferase involved in cell wall biosynthesis
MESTCELSIIVPVYAEEKGIYEFISRLTSVLEEIDRNFEVIFALDPSSDKTETLLREVCGRDPRMKLLVFSRRFGQPAATLAGFQAAKGIYCGVIDADLQDPPEILIEMLYWLENGYDVAYGQRISRKGETLVKKVISAAGYRVINRISEVQIPTDTGDFRLMSRRVVDEINRLTEQNGFLRGLVSYVGFKQVAVRYERDSRFAGIGSYNRYLGSAKIALNGIIGFSSKPLNYMGLVGGLISSLSFLFGFWYFIQKLLGFDLTPGLSTTVILITFFSGIQLLSIGLLGQYISRIYDEVKKRPTYIIDSKINFDD